MKILSIQVGQPKQYGVEGAEDPFERPWESAIAKEPVAGRVWLNREGVAGDSQADRSHHGGQHMAVLGYGAVHYPRWREELDDPELAFGAFGENLTITDATEGTVCIGDRFQAGDAVLEVSKPRQPCQTLARRFRRKDMIKRVLRRQAFGWYFRVLEDGWLESGMTLEVRDRPYPQWTVAEVERVMRGRNHHAEAAARLAQCVALPEDWRDQLGAVGEANGTPGTS